MVNRFRQATRLTYKQVRESLSTRFKDAAAKKIHLKIQTLEPYRYAKRIALYHAINGEISLNALWDSAPFQGKYCYFPVINDDLTLRFLPATPTTPFKKNRYGIQEPQVSRELAIDIDALDIIFMPLVAFDSNGTRIGMGTGYYDRSLKKESNPLLIGVAYEFQRMDYIEPQSWDIPLTMILTEKNNYIPKIIENA